MVRQLFFFLIGMLSLALAAESNDLALPGSNEDLLPREDFYIYRPIPDARVYTVSGPISIYQLLQDKPLLFTMVYTRCSGVCYPFVHSLKKAIGPVGGLGKDYRVLVVSFDPRDTPQSMANMARVLQLNDNPNWIFGTVSPEKITQLAASVGYWSKLDTSQNQYDHPAVLIGINRQKHIVRFLVGATVLPVRLKEVVQELRGEFIASYPLPNKNVIFRCFQYQPAEGIQLDWGFLLLLMPGVVTIGGSLWIFHRQARKHPREQPRP